MVIDFSIARSLVATRFTCAMLKFVNPTLLASEGVAANDGLDAPELVFVLANTNASVDVRLCLLVH